MALWDELHDFVQAIPQMRGRATPENLVTFTREVQASGEDYPKLSRTTLNSKYLGAIGRLARYGNTRRLYTWQPQPLTIAADKRATMAKARVPFSSEEITAISKCPVYTGSASRRHRYSAGPNVYPDDHIYWALLVAMHTGMRVIEIGMLRPEQR